MKNLSPPADEKRLLREVFLFSRARKAKLYIVGGYLRDILLKRRKKMCDIDFAVKRNAISFSSALAKKMKCGFVILDKGHGSSRLVRKIKDKVYTLDFTDFRGEDLQGDLLRRDFTVNSLALELGDFFTAGSRLSGLIDLYHAQEDLKARIIRRVDRRSFDDDPVRILRAFSFSCTLAFKIDKDTLKEIERKKNKLSGESPERLRDELFKILESPCTYDCLVEMDRLGVLSRLLPELEVMRGVEQGPYHHLDVFKHSLESVRQVEIVVGEFKRNQDIIGYLGEIISATRTRLALLKLGCLLHDLGKPAAMRHEEGRTLFHGHEAIGRGLAGGLLRRLKLSNDEIEILKKMIFWHLRPGYLADNPAISARAKFRYFRDTGKEGVSTLILSIADQRSTKGPLTTEESRLQHERVCRALIREYFEKQKEKRIVPLINGDEIMKKFKLLPGPLIGRILSELEELQAIGRIKNKSDAYKAAGRFIKLKRGK